MGQQESRGAEEVRYTGRMKRTVAGVAMLFMSKSSSDCIKIRITSCYNKSLSLFANLFPYFRGIANSPHFARRPKPRPVTVDSGQSERRAEGRAIV